MAYFRAFCEVSIIREALRKARFSCMETYLLFSLTGENVDGRKIVVGFRLWIRCYGRRRIHERFSVDLASFGYGFLEN